MSLLFLDSFDHYATGDIAEKWTAAEIFVQGTLSIGAFGRNSTNGLRAFGGATNNSNAQAKLTVSPSGVGFVCGFAYKTSATPSVGATKAGLFAVTDVGVIQVMLRLNNDMTISALRSNTTVLGTTSSALSVNVSTYIEVKGTIDPSAGSLAVYFNGINVLNLTGINTRATANTSWNGILLGVQIGTDGLSGGHFANCDFDDVYLFDQSGAAPCNDVVGDVRVACMFPTADGANTGLTPSTGTNHAALVDETPPNDDTDYNSTSSVGAKDTYVMGDLPVSGVGVYGVQVVVSNKKVDPTTAQICSVLRVGSTDYDQTSQAQSTAYTFNRFLAQANPATSAQWTESEVNNLQAGVKKTA